MYIQQVNQDGVSIALIRSEKPLMTDVQSALDLMMTVRAETGCKRIALNREAITGGIFSCFRRALRAKSCKNS